MPSTVSRPSVSRQDRTIRLAAALVVGCSQGRPNVIDAASAGASDGTILAINVAAMLIAFLSFIALLGGFLATLINRSIAAMLL